MFVPPFQGKLPLHFERGLALDNGHLAVLILPLLKVLIDRFLNLLYLPTLPHHYHRSSLLPDHFFLSLHLQATGVLASRYLPARVALVAVVASSPEHVINLIVYKAESSLVEGAEAVVGALVEARGAAVDDELRQGEDPVHVVLDLYVVVLELVVHLVEDGDHLCDAEVHPDQLVAAVLLAAEEVDQLVEVHPEALVHVLLPRALPADVLLVLAVAELEVVLDEVPVYRGRGGQAHPVLGQRPQQVEPVVLVQDVDDHGLDPADHLLSVFEVRQFDGWVLLQQLRVIFLLPFVLGQEDVFALLVRNEDVLEHQAHHFCLAADGPIHQRDLLAFGDLYLLGEAGEAFLF